MKSPLIIAELSANHNQSLELAKDSIRILAKIGADGIKLQTYTPECLTIPSRDSRFSISGGPWDGQYLYDLYKSAHTPWEWHQELFALARELGLLIFSSPFSPKGVMFLESLQCPMYKVASFEIMHEELIAAIAQTKKPIIISTGVATHKEIKRALEICTELGCCDITLLHCVSEYPAPIQSSSLGRISDLKKRYKKYGVKVGLSDHSIGSLCPILATSLGASMIEKHFILDRSLGGVDSAFSMQTDEFQAMIMQVRQATLALGNEKPQKATFKKRRQFARSIWTIKDIKKGEILSRENIAVLRPSGGLHPRYFTQLLGKKTHKSYKAAMPFKEKNLH